MFVSRLAVVYGVAFSYSDLTTGTRPRDHRSGLHMIGSLIETACVLVTAPWTQKNMIKHVSHDNA